MKFNRIYIIGGPGSGKSYAATRLSKILNIPHYELDNIFWHKKDINFTKTTPEKERNKKLQNILKKKQWIIEGVFSSFTKKCFERADCIIMLEAKKNLRAIRLIKRFFHRKIFLKRNKETVKGQLKFLKWNNQWDENNLLDIQQRIKAHQKKIKYFKLADDALNFFRSLK